MKTRIRIIDLIVVVLSVAFVLVADATSKNNHPHNTSPSKTINIISTSDSNSNSNSNSNNTIHSETIIPSTKKQKKSGNNGGSIAAKKKKERKPKKQQQPIQSSSGVASTSIRRIKNEYKDAVDMGIAYDWVNQRLIKRKRNTKKDSSADMGTSQTIMCLGPITSNLRRWHFSFRGAGEGVYSMGIYHGLIILPKDYPMSPPSVQMWTPSGRFIPFKDICLSASNYHPESWTPRWSIHGIVNALRLHMLSPPTEIGGMQSTHEEATKLARLSLVWKQTWVDGGNNKRTKITVDHRLLIQEGVLGYDRDSRELSDDEEEEGSEKIDEKETEKITGESFTVSTEDDSDDSNSDQVAVVEKEDGGGTRDGILNSNSDNDNDDNDDNDSVRVSTRFSFSMTTTVTSLFQLIFLYVLVILFLNR